MTDVQLLMQGLKEKANKLGNRACFLTMLANQTNVDDFEILLNISLPTSLKLFYLNFGGGFIADESIPGKYLNDYWWYDEGAEASNHFLSLTDIAYYYGLDENGPLNFKREEENTGKKLIPVLLTRNHNFFVWDATDISKTPILYEQENVDDMVVWTKAYSCFEDFLKTYFDKEGQIEIP